KGEALLLRGLKEGSIKFVLEGKKLRGEFALIKMKGRQKGAWLLIKKKYGAAVTEAYNSEHYLDKPATGKPKAPANN
ncbi:MAG: hypothetical protein LPK09_11820, partial [Hymenobacteraceae bacterium]|nr:hypothetical protein [Hymenobacteraceae bacterium]